MGIKHHVLIRPPMHSGEDADAPLNPFTGHRTFRIDPSGDGHATFTMTEEFTGPLSSMIAKSLPDFQASFDEFARALKADSEA